MKNDKSKLTRSGELPRLAEKRLQESDVDLTDMPLEDAVPALQAKAPLTISKSLSCVQLKMGDEERREMVAFH